MIGNNFVLWENENFLIKTPFNPHIAYSEGIHLIATPKIDVPHAWYDPQLSAQTFEIAAKACKIAEEAGMGPWFNLQANGNWGLLPGATPYFHVHIYGRNKTSTWGKPLVLPEAPNTYKNEPMPESDRQKLMELFKNNL